MSDNNHEFGIKIPEYKGYCQAVQFYIDRKRINAISMCPLDIDGRKIDDLEKMDLEYNIAELEVQDIEDIALLMNEETFNKFCKLWSEYHEKE